MQLFTISKSGALNAAGRAIKYRHDVKSIADMIAMKHINARIFSDGLYLVQYIDRPAGAAELATMIGLRLVS